MLDIYEMQIFVTAADTGSFSEAGRRLQMSQPAVSMQIRSLEQRVGVKLFQRAGRHIELTEAGNVLLPLAREMINLSIHAEETMASLKGNVVGVLRLACSTTAGKYLLPKLIAGFIEEHPDVQVACDVVSRGLALGKLEDGTTHLALTSIREPSRDLEYRVFTTDPIVLVVPPDHAWARIGHIPVDDLCRGRFIVRELSSGTQQAVVQALAEYDLGLNSLPQVMTLGNTEAIIMAVGEGIGVGFVSRRAADEALRHGRVVEVRVDGLDIQQQVYMVRHAHRAPTGPQTAFWEYVYRPENSAILDYRWN